MRHFLHLFLHRFRYLSLILAVLLPADVHLGALGLNSQGLPGLLGRLLSLGLLFVNSLTPWCVTRRTRRCGGGDGGLFVRKRGRHGRRRADMLAGVAAAFQVCLREQPGLFGGLALLLNEDDIHGVIAWPDLILPREGDAEDDDRVGYDGEAECKTKPVKRRDFRARRYFIQWFRCAGTYTFIIPAARQA